MRSLPLLASIATAAVVAPAAVAAFRAQGLERENYRGALVACPTGVVLVAAALLALVPVTLLDELADADVLTPGIGAATTYVVGVALLGLLDDFVGSGRPPRADDAPGSRTAASAEDPPRGWRGHARATARGGLSTGAIKTAGALGLALLVLSGRGLAAGEYLLAVALLLLATNFFNLLDLRPGRSAKALLLLGAGLTLGSLDVDPLWALGLFLGPVLVLLPIDLRERGMLGDTGSNAIGAVAGLWLVFTLTVTGQAIALALIAVATAYGEFRSISAVIDRTPGLRQLDSLGRASHA